jgi:crotonobetainyl-CoA:carnitine CoA-transferase CaiB-like acyl-CoA transferase
MAKRPALDLMIQAVSGLMSLTGDPNGRPVKAAAPVADVMGGFSAIVAVMGALMERQQTGEGRYLDISMLEGVVALMGQVIASYGMSGQTPARMGNGHPLAAPYESFRCADREIVIAVTNEKSWQQFVSIEEFAPLGANPNYRTQPLRSQNRKAMLAEVERTFLTKPASHWLGALERVGIPAEPINTLDDILAHPQLTDRGAIMSVEYPPASGNHIKIAGMPWRAVASEVPYRSPPDLGQHTREVLDEILGNADAKV